MFAEGRTALRRSDLQLYLAYCLTVPLVAGHFALFKALRTDPYLELDRYISGSERLPFQLRALSGWTGALLRKPLELLPLDRLPQPLNDPTAASFLLIDFVAISVAIVATWSTLSCLTGSRRFALIASMSVPVMGLFNFLLIANRWAFSYPYDLPQLALFALALQAIVRRQRIWLALWFTLASLNRDTAVFILLIWLLYEFGPRMPQARQMLHQPLARARSVLRPVARNLAFAILLAGVWIASRFLLMQLYRDNPAETGPFAAGGLFSTQHARRNLGYILKPVYWPSLASNFAFLWVVLIIGWRHLDVPGLRWSLLVLPPWIAVMTAVGVLTEMRVFGELIALLAVCIGVVWWRWMHEEVGKDSTTDGLERR